MTLISLLVVLLIAGFCAWVVSQLPFIGQPYRNIILGVIGLFVLFYLLQGFGLVTGLSLRVK